MPYIKKTSIKMTNILDVSLLQYFSPIFVMIFVFALSYAFLEKTKVLGKESKNINAIISFVIAIVFVFSSVMTQFLTGIIPGIFFVLVVIFFILAFVEFLGVKNDDLLSLLGGKKNAAWWVIIPVGIVVVIVASQIFGQQLVEGIGTNTSINATVSTNATTSSGSFSENLMSTLFNSKLLATVVILIIAAIAIKLFTTPPTK